MEIIQLPIIVLCILSVVVSCIFYKKYRNYFFACILSGIVSSFLFQIIGFLIVGHLDPFFLVAFLKITIIAFAISIVVGIAFFYKRIKSSGKA